MRVVVFVYRVFRDFFQILSRLIASLDATTHKDTAMLKSLWLMLFTLPLLWGCVNASTPAPAPAELRTLVETIAQRLEIANDVALSKFYSGKPVQDTDRERQVITNAESQAPTYHLEKDAVRVFMTSQIEANKIVQYGRIAQWHDHGHAPAQPAADAMAGIRERLDTLQPRMMKQFAAFQPWHKNNDCSRWVETEILRQTADPITASALQRATHDLCQTRSKS